MPMRSVNWGEALVPGIYKFFEIGLSLRPSLVPFLYNVQTSSLAEENHEGIGGIAPDAWDLYESSGNKAEVTFDAGFLTTFVHNEKPIQFIVERKLVDDDQHGIISRRARKLGISAGQKQQIDAASVFNNAFNSSYVGADGVELCDASHPASPTNSTSVQSNFGTYALTADNISVVRTKMMAFEDDKGNPLGVTPNLLLVPPALEDTALKAVRSALDPDTAENAMNPQFGRWIVQPWHYLTDSNAWFMIDTVWMKESLIWYNRKPLEIRLVGETTTDFQYEIYMRYSYGWTDWRWVYGCNPS